MSDPTVGPAQELTKTGGPASEVPAQPPHAASKRPTRISAAWVGVGAALLLLILLLIFILQNQARVRVHFLGFSPSMPLGVAMLLAAVIGGVAVAVSGVARIVQLRRANRRARRS